MRQRRPLAAFLLAATVLGLVLSTAPAAFAGDPAVPMIVVLEKNADVSAAVGRGRRDADVRPTTTFRHAARGYAAKLSRGQIRRLERDPAVAAIVPDSVVELTAQSTPAGIRRVNATKSPIADIDGEDVRVNVDVAIIDTGIQPNHPDLRVVGGYDCSRPGTAAERSSASRWKDEHGHGTHVAGIVGARDNSTGVVGVAPGARLWSVRVFDASGFSRISWIVCGIDWITGQRDPSDSSRPLIEVANMSLRDEGGDDGNCGFTVKDVEHQAICRSVSRGTTYVVAAGNDDRSTVRWRPSSYNEVITVSAMADYDGKSGGLASPTCTAFGRRDADDTYADFSNYGPDVDLIAPGVCVRSTYKGSSYATISGTSMATPHVAGGAALYAAAHPGASPSEIRGALRAAGLFDWRTSTDPDGTVDPLLDVSSFGAGAGLVVRTSSSSARLWPGTSTSLTARLTRLDGHSGTTQLSVSGLPDGVSASFSKTTFNGRDFGTTTLRLAAGPDAEAGSHKLAVRATSGSIEGSRTVTLTVERDDEAPMVGSVREDFVKGSKVTTSSVSVRTRWVASDGGSGLDRSRVLERRGSGDWVSLGAYKAGTTTLVRTQRNGTSFQHQVRAVDRAGNVSDDEAGPRVRSTLYSEGTSLATYSGRWLTARPSSALGDRVRYSTRSGASVTVRFNGRGIGWVSTLASNRGRARVYVDGALISTVDLRSTKAKVRRVVFARTVSPGSHTLRIVVLGTSGRPRVDVDGFLIMR